MTEVCIGYTFNLPPIKQIIDNSIKDTLNIFTSFLELGKKYKLQRDRNFFRVFIQKIEDILPTKTKDAIIKDILVKLPDRQWLISDYDQIMQIFIKRITNKKIEGIDSLIGSTFKNRREVKRFATLFFNEIVISTKQNQEFWQNLILEEEDTDKMHIYNEISLSLRDMGAISEKYSNILNQKSMDVMKCMILQSLRITKTLYYLQNQKNESAISNSKFLRSERFEMKHNA